MQRRLRRPSTQHLRVLRSCRRRPATALSLGAGLLQATRRPALSPASSSCRRLVTQRCHGRHLVAGALSTSAATGVIWLQASCHLGLHRAPSCCRRPVAQRCNGAPSCHGPLGIPPVTGRSSATRVFSSLRSFHVCPNENPAGLVRVGGSADYHCAHPFFHFKT